MGKGTCSIAECGRPHVARGWCGPHYARWRSHGDPEYRIRGEIRGGRKVCNRCGEDLPLDAFGPDAATKTGLDRQCRACRSLTSTEWAMRNPDRIRETQRRYMASNLEARREKSRRYAAENRERAREYQRRYTEQYPDKAREYTARRRARKLSTTVESINRLEVFERDGWICGICGVAIDPQARWPESQFASVDHVVPLSKGGTHTLENLQAAHLGCNLRKGASLETVEGTNRG